MIATLLMICSASEATPAKLQIFSNLENAILIAVRRFSPQLLDPDNSVSTILQALIYGASEEDVSLQLAGIRLPEQFCVMAITPQRYLGRDYVKHTVIPELTRLLPKAMVVQSGQELALVDPFDFGVDIELERLEQMRRITGQFYFRLGISLPFDNICRLRQYYQQALRAVELGLQYDPELTVWRYCDYLTIDLLSNVNLREPSALGEFCHPILSKLRRYDREHDTELYKTLNVCLHNNFKLNKAADELFIHRNSLTRRLEKITELCRFDPSDSDVFPILLLSYEIEHYLHQDV